jgi:hypothetical protein
MDLKTIKARHDDFCQTHGNVDRGDAAYCLFDQLDCATCLALFVKILTYLSEESNERHKAVN